MPPIKTAEDALMLCRRLAEYHQRRLNRLAGVGPHRARSSAFYDMLREKIMRDAMSEAARRIHRGIEQGKHPTLKRPSRGRGRTDGGKKK